MYFVVATICAVTVGTGTRWSYSSDDGPCYYGNLDDVSDSVMLYTLLWCKS